MAAVLISMVEQPNQQLMTEHGVTALLMSTNVNTESLNQLAKLITDGTIKPQIDQVFALGQVTEAFTHLQSGFPKGKIVIKIS